MIHFAECPVNVPPFIEDKLALTQENEKVLTYEQHNYLDFLGRKQVPPFFHHTLNLQVYISWMRPTQDGNKML